MSAEMKVKIIGMIAKIIVKYPELRFLQIIGNCYGTNDIYYKEDCDLIEQLQNIYPDVFDD